MSEYTQVEQPWRNWPSRAGPSSTKAPTSEHVPGERLVVCRNPALAEERARKRLELLAATEAELAKIAAATQRARKALRGEQAIALRVGRVIERFHMAKHFELTITDSALSWRRKDEAIAAEAALDGLYVIRIKD